MKIEVPLYGGLGNQLFGYAFGLYSHVFGRHHVKFVLAPDSPWNASHNQNVCLDFDFETNLPWSIGGRLDYLKAGVMRYAGRKFPDVLGKHLKYQDEESWNDSLIDEQSGSWINVSGYFRTPKYLRALHEKGIMKYLRPRFAVEETHALIERIKSTDAIGLHVRRGDYTAIGASLPTSYFARALGQIESSMDRKVLVFSDSLEQVRYEFQKYSTIYDFEFVKLDLPSTQIAAVSMSAMAECRTLIMSNSTFSWWSASTGNMSKMVYYPQDWNSNIMSSEWIKVNTSFL